MKEKKVVIVGAGFCGLTAAYELCKKGYRPVVIDSDNQVGGLAGSFTTSTGQRLEKFYHHWFTNDLHVNELVADLGLADQIVHRPTRTGSYYANTVFRLSKPMDVLRYSALSFIGRLRLGFLVIQAKLVRDWRKLESESAEGWLRRKCGNEVFERVWQPLLKGKFGGFSDQISAVWFWSKLALRGGSRGKGGQEILAYYQGGFAALAEALAERVKAMGGEIHLATSATGFEVDAGRVTGVHTSAGFFKAEAVIQTSALPVFADMAAPFVSLEYLQALRSIQYIGNVCLTLELDRSLSDTYWINVADPHFPFVGVIEHTNFEPTASYGGRHIVYLSKYLPTDSEMYQMEDDALLAYAVPFIQRMFPAFDSGWVKAFHVYRAEYSQPIVVRHYSKLIPEMRTPVGGVYLATMAQIYPEDRGTNYAIRQGRQVSELLVRDHGLV